MVYFHLFEMEEGTTTCTTSEKTELSHVEIPRDSSSLQTDWLATVGENSPLHIDLLSSMVATI